MALNAVTPCLAADGQRARAVGVQAERAGGGVAVDDVDLLRVDPEPVELGLQRCIQFFKRRRCD